MYRDVGLVGTRRFLSSEHETGSWYNAVRIHAEQASLFMVSTYARGKGLKKDWDRCALDDNCMNTEKESGNNRCMYRL